MIAQAEAIAGPGAAEQLREQMEMLERLVRRPSRRSTAWRDASDLDRDETGALLIHPQNLPAVQAWLLVHDQWIRAGMEAEPVALNMGVALEVVRELRASPNSGRVDVLDTLSRLRILAAEVLTLERTARPRQGRS